MASLSGVTQRDPEILSGAPIFVGTRVAVLDAALEGIAELFGQLEWDESIDHKAERNR